MFFFISDCYSGILRERVQHYLPDYNYSAVQEITIPDYCNVVNSYKW